MKILTEISENVTLYHRSNYPMTVGDLIKSKRSEDGKHWLENIPSEIGLEFYRRKHFSDKPSRLNCVYSSVIPRSRFVDKGILYVVKPRGKIHVANSTLIDEFHEKFDRDNPNFEEIRRIAKERPERLEWEIDPFLAELYWKNDGKKAKREDVEILSESAVVIEIIDDSHKRIQPNKTYEVTEAGVLFFWFKLYSKDFGQPTEREMSVFNKLKKYLFSDLEEDGGLSKTEAKGYLRKGLKIKPQTVRTAMMKSVDDIHSGQKENLGKYSQISVGFEIGHKWYESYKDKLAGMNFSLTAHSFMKRYHKQPWDYGKYLKLV